MNRQSLKLLYLCGRQHGGGVVAVYGRVVAKRLVLGLHPREQGRGRRGTVRRLVVYVVRLEEILVSIVSESIFPSIPKTEPGSYLSRLGTMFSPSL